MVEKEIIFNEEQKKIFGGVRGVMIYLKDDQVVDESIATTSLLNIYDEQGNNIRRIYGDLEGWNNMLYNPPLEIIELLESIYDESGRMIGEKLSDDATPEQRALYEQYQKECNEQLEKFNNQFQIKH